LRYNAILSVNDITDDSDVGAEPITRQEVKDYLRLEGFTDLGESTSESLSDFDYDDDLIDDSIQAVREMFEQKCSFHLIPKTLEVVLCNGKGMIELPGPVRGAITTLKNDEGDTIDTDLITVVGNKWKFLKCPTYHDMVATYEAGFIEVPKAIKLDLIRAAAYFYLNRGDKESFVFISQLASKHSRNVWL
jgi:hypothetical protein